MTFPIGSTKDYLDLLKKGDYRKAPHFYSTCDHNGDPVSFERPVLAVAKGKSAAVQTGNSGPFPFFSSTPRRPQWLALDKLVLHFNAYSHEGPVESRAEEDFRIRFCEIYFYLEDETIMIMERHDDRAEMSHDKLLNRQRVPKNTDPDVHLTVHDFNIDQSVIIFGRRYLIYNCDQFTRDTLTKLGVDVPAEMSPPFSQHLVDSAAEKHLSHRLRRHISRNHPMERFLNFDTKVLRFYAYWDDRERLFGDRHFLVVHYYLGDQTMEIFRKNRSNHGKERLEPFMKRSKIPKVVRDYDKVNEQCPWPVLNIVTPKRPETARLLFDQAQFDSLPEFFTDKDLRCGKTIPIMARAIFFYDCDTFTKFYYKETYGYEMKTVAPEETTEQQPSKMPPPYNGYGAEEDSLGNVTHLVPKPPLLDVRKYCMLDWNDEDPDKLIFKLKLVTDYNLDHARSFIMSYCLNNDNIYIYEKFAPEGVATGSFHSRKSVKKLNDPVTDVPGYVQPQDMYIGGEYLFNGQTFVIAETDECTAKFMEKYPARFPYADNQQILEKLGRIAKLRTEPSFDHLSASLDSTDPAQTGLTEWNSFINALMTMAGNSLVPHEYFTLARHYQTHTQADKEKMIQLFRSLIQHGFRRQNWEPTTPMLRAFMRADPAERGYLSVSEILRCVKAVRAPVPMPVMTTYLDLVADPENKIYYTPMVKNLDWIVSPGKKLSDVPQTIGKDFDYNKFFGDIVPIVRYESFLDDLKTVVHSINTP